MGSGSCQTNLPFITRKLNTLFFKKKSYKYDLNLQLSALKIACNKIERKTTVKCWGVMLD